MRVSREIGVPPETGFKPGDTIGGYEIERLIGVGGMADVFLARHCKLDKRVAVKVLRAHARDRSDLRARFLREGQAASRIRNPHVVEIFDVGSEGDVPYLVMQYLPGPTLEEHMAERGALDVREAVHIFLPIVAAVAAGHEEGVIHRDLKPDNVILAVEGHRTRPTVLDFGVSRLVTSDPRLTLDSSVVGTPHYMSPEQARGEAIDSKTDQYALGVMLYESITGRLPRDRASVLELINEVGHQGFEPPSAHRPSLPREFEDVILKAMAQSRKQRFDTMHDMAAALLPFASENARVFWSEELGIKPTRVDAVSLRAPDARQVSEAAATLPPGARGPIEPPDTIAERGEPRSSRGVILALLGLVAAVVGIALAWFLLRGPAEPEAYVAEIDVTPPVATLTIDGELVGQGEAHLRFAVDGQTHRLEVAAPGYEPRVITFRDAPPPSRLSLEPVAAPVVEADPVAEADPPPPADPSVPVEAPPEEPAVELGGDDAPAAEPRAAGRRQGRSRRSAPRNEPPAEERAEAPEPEPAQAPPAANPTAPGWRPSNERTDNLDPWTR